MNPICLKCKKPLISELFEINKEYIIGQNFYLLKCLNKKCKWNKIK